MGSGKAEAHAQAIALWGKSPNTPSALCDKCSALLKRGRGYLCKPLGVMGPYDLLCESCFDTSPTAEPFEGSITVTLESDSKTGWAIPWGSILFLGAFVLTAAVWIGAIYLALTRWQGFVSAIQLILGLTLAGEAVILGFDLWKDRAGAKAKFLLYGFTLMLYIIFLLFNKKPPAGVWVVMIVVWGGIVLGMFSYVDKHY
jgi:hypothetical protein